ncbi:hypothetical protein OPV22_028742 [Ensete ventricosum]|uniref:Pentacotripeptide-repeat region of PRORP domain-containing protein n=1 Tax=Ensete ventricosum TaxID=4639 RepID=A0AAV8QBC3_ENSVE|nr:hypothetical protein OPV22_028742 [Ensete ventricosum]
MRRSTVVIRPRLAAAAYNPTRCSSSSSSSSHSASIPTVDSLDPLSELSSVLARSNWLDDPRLPLLAPSLTPHHVAALLRSRPLEPRVALGFFDWISLRPGFRHTVDTYSSLVQTVARANLSPRGAEKIVISMIKSCSSAVEIHSALQSFKSLHQIGFLPSLRCHNFMMMKFARFQMIAEMKELFEQMQKDGIFPNLHTYNTIINAHCKEGNIIEAKAYLNYLLQAGLDPDTHTYTSFILGYCQSDDFVRACRLFLLMPLRGCARNEFSYTVLSHGLCEAGKVKEGLSLFSLMDNDGCSADLHIYTVMIGGLCKVGRDVDAKMMLYEISQKEGAMALEQMISSGCKPDVFTYTILVKSYCMEGRLEEAESLMIQMQRNGIAPNVVTYNTYIEGLVNMGLFDQAFSTFMTMAEAACEPIDETYRILLKLHLKKKQVDGDFIDAKRMWEKVSLDVVLELFEEMAKQGFTPTAKSYSCLVKSFCKLDRLEEAKSLLFHMQETCKAPRSLDEAKSVFTSLLSRGYNCDEIAWKILIDALLRKGHVDMCSNFLTIMEENHCAPSPETYDNLTKELSCIVNDD